MKRLLLLAALCAFSSAMVFRPRRAVNTDELQQPSTTAIHFCADSTPCGWIFYTLNKNVETHEPNPYCRCDPKKECTKDEEDPNALSWIKKCKPKDGEKTEETEINTESEKNAES